MIKEKRIRKLSKEIDLCTKCPLHKERKNAVPGAGNVNSEFLIIGEAPGKKEDEEKKTFVGKAGQILDLLLKEINLTRDDFFYLTWLNAGLQIIEIQNYMK